MLRDAACGNGIPIPSHPIPIPIPAPFPAQAVAKYSAALEADPENCSVRPCGAAPPRPTPRTVRYGQPRHSGWTVYAVLAPPCLKGRQRREGYGAKAMASG